MIGMKRSNCISHLLRGQVTASTAGVVLLEVIVSMSIFSVLLVMVVGIFSHFTYMQRRDIGEQRLQEDMRFALELFNREVRTGYGDTFRVEGDALFFRNQNRSCVTYRWLPLRQTLQRAENTLTTDSCELAPYETYQDLLSADTHVKELDFLVEPGAVTGQTLGNQAFVTLSLRVASAKKSSVDVHLQSSVASRQLIPY